MSLNITQFAQTPVLGQLDLLFKGGVISGQVDAAEATTLIAGQVVKMATTAGGVPKFIKLAAVTDKPFGVIARNIKDLGFPANAPFELAFKESVIYMTAGGAITRGGNVEATLVAGQVIASAGVNPVLGFALDTAVNSGDLIRVYIVVPSVASTTAAQQVVIVTATIAEINAGKVLIPGQTGQKITVTNYIARVLGNFATGTAIILESTNGAPVVVSTIAEAALTTGAVNLPSSANNTLGAGFAAQLGSGDGLQVVNSGAAQTAGTSVTFTISYTQA